MKKNSYLMGIDDFEPTLEQYHEIITRMNKNAVAALPYLKAFVLLLFIGGVFGIIFSLAVRTMENIRLSVGMFIESIAYIWVAVRFNEVLKIVKILEAKGKPSIPRLMGYSSATKNAFQAMAIGFLVVITIEIFFSLI